MLMHCHTKFGCERFCGSEDTVWAKSEYMDRQTRLLKHVFQFRTKVANFFNVSIFAELGDHVKLCDHVKSCDQINTLLNSVTVVDAFLWQKASKISHAKN